MKKYIIMLVICISSFMIYTNNVFAKTFSYEPSLGYARSGNQSWTGFNVNNFNFSGVTWNTIRPNNSPTAVMFEYGLPLNVKGVLSFSILSSGQFKSIPIVTGYYGGNYFTCDNSGIPTYNTGDEGYYFLTYYCDNYDSSGGNAYNNLQFQFNAIYDPVTVFGVTNFMVVNDDINVSLYELNTKLSSINSSLSGISGQIDSINGKLDSINSTQHQDNQNTQQKIDNIDSTLNDSSIDSSGTSSSASSWASKNATNGTITNLLTLPISLLQNILNGIQTSCSSFSLGTLFNTELILPCINLSSLIGSTLFNVIDLLFSGFMILNISKKLIKIFNDFTNLKSNQIDEIYSNGGGAS